MGILSTVKSLFSKKKDEKQLQVAEQAVPTTTPEPVVVDNETLTHQIEEPKPTKKIEVKKAEPKKETVAKEQKKTSAKKQTKKEK
jgi:hypothetical protein